MWLVTPWTIAGQLDVDVVYVGTTLPIYIHQSHNLQSPIAHTDTWHLLSNQQSSIWACGQCHQGRLITWLRPYQHCLVPHIMLHLLSVTQQIMSIYDDDDDGDDDDHNDTVVAVVTRDISQYMAFQLDWLFSIDT